MLNLRIPIGRLVSSAEVIADIGALNALRFVQSARMAILVSGSGFQNHEFMELIKKSLKGIHFQIFPMKSGEPTISKLEVVTHEMSSFKPDWIVAIGGGSVIDGAKIAWIKYEHPDVNIESETSHLNAPKLRGKAKFIAVPTTAGTGSEVSSSALFLDDKSGFKKYFFSHELLPDVAILDPKLLKFTPKKYLNASIMDAVSHSLEGYVSKVKNIYADVIAEDAIGALFQFLNEKDETSDIELEKLLRLQIAALMSGQVQNLKVPGIGHAMAHQLAKFGVPHGLGCGFLLPNAMEFNRTKPEVNSKYEYLENRLHLSKGNLTSKVKDYLDTLDLYNWFNSFELRNTLKSKEVIENIFDGVTKDICSSMNPREVDRDAIDLFIEKI